MILGKLHQEMNGLEDISSVDLSGELLKSLIPAHLQPWYDGSVIVGGGHGGILIIK